jgi:hypothetical protein
VRPQVPLSALQKEKGEGDRTGTWIYALLNTTSLFPYFLQAKLWQLRRCSSPRKFWKKLGVVCMPEDHEFEVAKTKVAGPCFKKKGGGRLVEWLK